MKLLSELNRSPNQDIQGYPLVVAVAMGADITSAAFKVEHMVALAVECAWSAGATPVGTLQLQGSVTGNNWKIIGSAVAVSGDTGNLLLQDNSFGYVLARIVYTRTSGNGTLSAWAEAKGF